SPSYHSAEAGAALLVLADAIRRANSLNTAAVRAALGTMHIMTFFGEFQIDSRGLQVAHSMVVVQWQAGALKIVQPQDVAESPVQYPYTGSSRPSHEPMADASVIVAQARFGLTRG